MELRGLPSVRTSLLKMLDRLHVFKSNAFLNVALAAGNLYAVYYGWTDYYAAQLERTDPALWIFVPDSPNAVLAFALAMLLYLARLRHPILDLLAWVVNIKVGLWTVFVLLYYYEPFFSVDPILRWFLFWLHVGMIGQAFVLHRDLRTHGIPVWVYGLVAAWVLMGDVLDYALPIHPSLPGSHPGLPGYELPLMTALVTLAITLAVLAWGWILYRPGRLTPLAEPA